MTNYNNIDYLLDFNIYEFYKLIKYRYEQNTEEKLYNRWIIGSYDKECSFDDFKNKLLGKKENNNNSNNIISSKERARLNRLDV